MEVKENTDTLKKFEIYGSDTKIWPSFSDEEIDLLLRLYPNSGKAKYIAEINVSTLEEIREVGRLEMVLVKFNINTRGLSKDKSLLLNALEYLIPYFTMEKYPSQTLINSVSEVVMGVLWSSFLDGIPELLTNYKWKMLLTAIEELRLPYNAEENLKVVINIFTHSKMNRTPLPFFYRLLHLDYDEMTVYLRNELAKVYLYGTLGNMDDEVDVRDRLIRLGFGICMGWSLNSDIYSRYPMDKFMVQDTVSIVASYFIEEINNVQTNSVQPSENVNKLEKFMKSMTIALPHDLYGLLNKVIITVKRRYPQMIRW